MGELATYRVYGVRPGGDVVDEYCQAMSAQHAADRVREWYSYGGGDGVEVLEVAKVLKSWK